MILLWILIFLWITRISANVFSYIHLWYIKEYRLDRMRIHFRTPQGKRLLLIPWRLPPLTPKTIILAIMSLGVLFFLYFSLDIPILIRLLILDLISFPLLSFLVFIMSLPTKVYHRYQIRRAEHKLASHKTMEVAGITGSYGKTSTKDYLATILGSQFHVMKTEASKNSPIGIAETILHTLRVAHTAFVVEMGAYRPGEIEYMTAMVHPQIGIVTAINAQHQDLFGTLDTTMNAKYELLHGLSGKNIAIVNGDDDRTVVLGQRAVKEGKTVWVYTKSAKNSYPFASKLFRASKITWDLSGLEFTLQSDSESVVVVASVVGIHQVSNLLAAVAGAVACGMSIKDAVKAAREVRPAHKVLEVIPGIHGSVFINDTFNNNPDAAKAALTVLAKAKKKKYLVFQPMIELGRYADASHEEVGKVAGSVCDGIVLTNQNFFVPFAKGVKKTNPQLKVLVYNAQEAAEYLRKVVTDGDTVLFKSKEAEFVLKKLLPDA